MVFTLSRIGHDCVGTVLALILIISGRVRRARREAFRQEAISAISFHRPNHRLFLRCVSVADQEWIHLYLRERCH